MYYWGHKDVWNTLPKYATCQNMNVLMWDYLLSLTVRCVSSLSLLSVPLLPALHHRGTRELHPHPHRPDAGWRGPHHQQGAALPARPGPVLPLSAAHHRGRCRLLHASPALLRQPGRHLDVRCGGHPVECLLHRVLPVRDEVGWGYWWGSVCGSIREGPMPASFSLPKCKICIMCIKQLVCCPPFSFCTVWFLCP